MSTAASTGGGSASTGITQSTGGAPQSTGAAAFAWGDGWRERFAAGSTDPDKDRKQLERYESPEQVWKKARELERKMSAGELRAPLKADASDAEKLQWRKDNGIPDSPKGYKINMPEGRQPPKEDDAFLQAFLTNAHAANYDQGMVDATIKTFYAEVDRQQVAMTDAEKKAVGECEEKLRSEWGADYRANKAMAEALLARAPKGFSDRFLNGFLDDHSPIKGSVDAWKWLVQIEREINPAATVLPGTTGNLGEAIEGELAGLKKEMANPNSAYWKGPEAEKKQARYRDLIEADGKLKKKAA